MNISILQICLISLFYCFSNISWPFGSMGQWATINRPLVGGLVVGLILGNPVQGTIIGATINVIYLGLVSAGGSLPADSGMAGIMGTTFALIGGLDTNTALALAVPMGLVGAVIEVLTMTGQCMLIPLADKWIEPGQVQARYLGKHLDSVHCQVHYPFHHRLCHPVLRLQCPRQRDECTERPCPRCTERHGRHASGSRRRHDAAVHL